MYFRQNGFLKVKDTVSDDKLTVPRKDSLNADQFRKDERYATLLKKLCRCLLEHSAFLHKLNLGAFI